MIKIKSVKILGLVFILWSALNLFGELIISKMGLVYDSLDLSSLMWWLIQALTFPVWIGREFLNSFFNLLKNYEIFLAYVIAITLIWLMFIVLKQLLNKPSKE